MDHLSHLMRLPLFVQLRRMRADGRSAAEVAEALGMDPVEVAALFERLELMESRRRPR